MVSGPDYDPENPYRRTYEDAALVTSTAFLRAMARSCLAQVRQDFMFLPQVRAVWYKHRVEHTATTHMPFMGRRGEPTEHLATRHVADAKRLNEVLCKGTIGKEGRRTPVAGDLTKLPNANDSMSSPSRRDIWQGR